MLNTYFRALVGVFIMASVIMAVYVNINWLWFTMFIGANMFQSAFTKWCLLEKILLKLGIKKEAGGSAA
ncbi:DUF2892 domain-containing protein [Maribacter polysiphoniae]|uniref:DUF2892 domain-containing protein n=1 Tax=Maribacter polysiphoniae TaxID=429344 RepID=A0A316DU44_9FLAO|nr:DUF2892 domain-containing protein [Maribacter polysiphoniae]MBD1262261.1 DUF2892 domain-containing protein [Maribacter polysiphoniae]PWK21475.1 Protein of unknown function (DUF2892) [Maribacter polysiphoniae]